MPRFSEKTYQRRMWLAMSAYIGCMLLLWPRVDAVSETALKVVLALLPVVPMLYVIGLMMRRIRDSDELEQRTHLVALGMATMVVSVLSLGAGFLAAAHVLVLDGAILIWVFPIIMISYGVTRWWVARRYGMDPGCDGASGMPVYLRLLLAAGVIALGAFVFRHQLDAQDLAVLCTMACVFAVIGALCGLIRWRSRQRRGGKAS